MPKKRTSTEEIITKLREAEILQAKGQGIGEIVRAWGVSEQTYYRWKKEYGGLKIDQAKRLKQLEVENNRLRKVVSDLSIDNVILKEASRGNF